NTEVATVRTETSQAITFTTETDLIIRPPTVIEAFTRNASHNDAWVRHNLSQAQIARRRMPIFPPQPGPRDAFLLAFETDHSNHLLALLLSCERAGGAGVDPKNPPIQWQVWQGGAARWVACELEFDGTGGFNESGEVILHVPAMSRIEFQGLNAYWLRCVLTDAQSGERAYKLSPVLQQVRVEARGGTVSARHAITVKNEIAGTSDGTPGQTFKLLHTPILSLDPQQDSLVVEPPAGTAAGQPWQEVADFADSGPEDRHFTFDKLDGTITLGPSLLQPDGRVYRFGSVPEKGSLLRFTRYQYGGGVTGNISQNTLTVLKSSIPYVAHVTNRAPAVGGRDAQSLDDARLRAPQKLRTRTRAVTADDHEYLASIVPGVARARCLAPGVQPGDPNAPKPGQVFVIVLPQIDVPQGLIPSASLGLSAELRAAVLSHLDSRRLLGTALEVRPPQYIWIAVQAELHVPERSDPALVSQVQQRAEEALYRYLNPYIGGAHGDGWPFGRSLNRSELFGVLQSVEYVEFVEDVQISITDGSGVISPAAAGSTLRAVPVPRHGLICSDRHQVKVR
ncbi:MAG TPA: putative baseplate assembly protein, partial [Ktedonobacteraceae bacterium]|nr:putative baseplate assembly protein [Ktedonobacteraceae bacterium]